MPVNLETPELKETRVDTLPPASLETLKRMRQEACSQSGSSEFKLQPQQRFLRRVLSPDSPVRNLLMAHGAGAGKTCAAIQIAEEYILRPEFQYKKVLVLANPSVQENFKSAIFDMSRVVIDNDGLLTTKQCTGRRYLDMLLRIHTEPMRWTDRRVSEQLKVIAQKLINEFYEFKGYITFANELDAERMKGTVDSWIHETFDNRLIIVDEAHTLKDTSEGITGKKISVALGDIVKKAENVTLVLLTATPMFDRYDEILYYFTLFLWNDRRLAANQTLGPIFSKSGEFVSASAEQKFRGWCQEYVSFIRGDNPFTFPFRLPPPDDMIAPPSTSRDYKNRVIPQEEQRKYLPLVQSFVQGTQAEALKADTAEIQYNIIDRRIICVYPEQRNFTNTFETRGSSYAYRQGIPQFLAPSQVANYSSKFALIMKCIEESVGIVFVYSNLVQDGTIPFTMCLEEHGFEPALGDRMLQETSNEVPRGSRGRYVSFSEITTADLKNVFHRLRNPKNVGGDDIRIIVGSPQIAEGIDFQFVRQVHVLDPWFNMSRLEQITGRGIRTCSHTLLPFEHQNCTVYYHICKFPDSKREVRDETIYRLYVEVKAVAIAKIKRVIMESAMDCPLQEEVNRLPADWRGLQIPQIRSQRQESIQIPLEKTFLESFGASPEDLVCKVSPGTPDPTHVRPLSAILDVRDEILDKILRLFARKSVWKLEEMKKTPELRMYDTDTLVYVLQDAIETGFRVKNKVGKIGEIESRGDMYAFGTGILQDRTLLPPTGRQVPLPVREEKVEKDVPKDISLLEKRATYSWISDSFSPEVMDWFIVDQVLTQEEKIEHIKTLDWSNPPIYARNIRVGNMYVFGPKKILDKNFEEFTPIGEDADTISRWIDQRKDLFIDTRSQFFATVKNGTLLFNIDNDPTTLKTADRSKVIGGRACTNFLEPTLNLFLEWLNGSPFPRTVKTGPHRCQYLGLVVRDAILKKKEGLIWWTPEEWSFFTEVAIRKELLSRLK
jgi:hypothetical protein